MSSSQYGRLLPCSGRVACVAFVVIVSACGGGSADPSVLAANARDTPQDIADGQASARARVSPVSSHVQGRVAIGSPAAKSLLLQASGGSRAIFPDPEAILGRRLITELSASDALAHSTADDDELEVVEGSANLLKHGDGKSARKYFVTDLGTLGGTESFAYAINDSAQVVGQSRLVGDTATHSFLYSDGQMTDLQPLNSGPQLLTVGPTGINDSGQVVSGVEAGGIYSPALLDTRSGVLSLLGSLGGVTSYGFNGVATAINSRGVAVGYSYVDPINRHAFIYSNGAMTDIDLYGGYSAALDINEEGVAVGFTSRQWNGTATAFMYRRGVMEGIFPSQTQSAARGVNRQGQVVGDFLNPDGTASHAFLYSKGVLTDIGSKDSPDTVAFAINDHEQIVGTKTVSYKATCPSGPCIRFKQQAFLYEDGKMTALNRLIPDKSGWDLNWAFDINNHGQIVGYGLTGDKFRAFLLTPATSREQCVKDGWQTYGFKNQGQCVRFVNGGE
jgi:probable HAF family extracellular repeat protein